MHRERDSRASNKISVTRSVSQWWHAVAAREGATAATRKLVGLLYEFARDSTPERRRSRYGDADYDWEHRVNTTSGTVGWRNRLLGMFHSPYQPTETALFHEILAALSNHSHADFQRFTFIDLGSGKGRTLLMASDYPFRRIIGIELLPELHAAALDNLRRYKSESQKCFALESICADATEFVFPVEPLVIYLFNPFPEDGLRRVIANLEGSLRDHPRPVYVLYHNPLLERVLSGSMALKRIGRSEQYVMFAGE